MRSEVTIDGVKLTRAQVQSALDELNKPEEVVFRGGDRVTVKGFNGFWLVPDTYVRTTILCYDTDWASKGRIPVICLTVGNVIGPLPSDLTLDPDYAPNFVGRSK